MEELKNEIGMLSKKQKRQLVRALIYIAISIVLATAMFYYLVGIININIDCVPSWNWNFWNILLIVAMYITTILVIFDVFKELDLSIREYFDNRR